MSEQDPTPPTPRSPDEHELSALISRGAESDSNSNAGEIAGNITMGKESPLTDIATSPPPFDLNLNQADFGSDDSRSSNLNNNRNDVNDDIVHDATDGRGYGFGGIRRRKDSYESSELSDLDDDQSEAETDKMDFLDDDDEAKDRSQGEVDVSDLRRLSKLTELARLKDVDSSDESEKETSVKDEVDEDNQEEEIQDENSNSNNIERKRELEDEETSNNNKKSKVEKATSKKDRKQQALEPNDETEDGKIKDEPTISNEIAIPDDEQVSVDAVIENDDITSNADAGDEANEAEDEDDEASSKNEDNQEDETSHKEGDDELEADEADDDDNDDNNNSNTNEQEQLEDQVDLNEQRKLAIEELISIESRFAELRDKLYQDKLNLLERELSLCLEGSHPELSKVYYKINGFYQDSLKLANSNLAYKLKCIDKETIATRTSIHQNFLKNLMDTKNQMITDTTSLWYKINKERNQLDQLVPAFNFSAMPDVSQASAPIEYDGGSGSFMAANAAQYNGSVYHDEALMPISKRAVKQSTLVELVHQRNSINEQLGVLNGLIQFHGFPVAVNSTLSEQNNNPKTYPEELLLKRATDNEINDDLKAMGIST